MSRQKKTLQELGRLSPAAYAATDKLPLSLVLDNIRSANNVGSLFRTADCFALRHVYLCGITATPPHRDILKTALGATGTVDWSYHEDCATLIQDLLRAGPSTTESGLANASQVVALEQTQRSTPLTAYTAPPATPLLLVVGNEVQGVAQTVIDQCHQTLEIEQFGTKHSLNVAVSAGIAVWELSRQLRILGGR